MIPRIIKTQAQHRQALDEIQRLTEAAAPRNSSAADKLELLLRLARDYENARLARSCPDSLAAIRFRMRERGLRQKDLAALLGGKNRVSEVLSGKRSLTVAMIRALSQSLDIPAELLLRDRGRSSSIADAQRKSGK